METNVISHSQDGLCAVIEIFSSNHKALKHVSELVAGEYPEKPEPHKDVQEYLSEYYDWVREENDNMCSVDITIKVIVDYNNCPPAEKVIRNIDWDKLKTQKEFLLHAITKETGMAHDSLNGIIHLLDAIQDCAVDYLGIEEAKVFNLSND